MHDTKVTVEVEVDLKDLINNGKAKIKQPQPKAKDKPTAEDKVAEGQTQILLG